MKVLIYYLTQVEIDEEETLLNLQGIKMYCEKMSWDVVDIKVDSTKKGKIKLKEIINDSDINYDAIVVRYFYHISRSTSTFLKTLETLDNKNIKLLSIVEGEIKYDKR